MLWGGVWWHSRLLCTSSSKGTRHLRRSFQVKQYFPKGTTQWVLAHTRRQQESRMPLARGTPYL